MNEKIWVEKIRTSVRSTYAILFAIFLTAEVLCAFLESLITTGKLSFNILSLLMCIAVWVVIGSASKDDYCGKGLRFVSGIIKTEFILIWIGACCMVVAGMIVLAFGDKITHSVYKAMELFAEGKIATMIINAVSGFIGIAGLIYAVLLILYNYLHVYKEHKFVKSLRETVDTDTNCVCEQKDVMIWMIILAVAALIGLIGSLFEDFSPLKILEHICNILKYLCVFKFVRDNFGKKELAEFH